MRLGHFDLPLRESAPSCFMPWTIGALLYLAIVALALAALADETLRLHLSRAKLATVSLPAVAGSGSGQPELAAVMEIVRATPGVISAALVPPAEVAALVQPWLGDGSTDTDLPLPTLIDVTLDPRSDTDLPALEQRLHRVVEGATVGAAATAGDRGTPLAILVRAWGSAAGVGALLVMLALVALITGISLRTVAESVELLRSMGAPDGYLARQFERHALLSSLYGGGTGLVLALLTVLGILYSAGRTRLAEADELALPLSEWVLLVCVAVVAVLLITAIARLSARWGLVRKP